MGAAVGPATMGKTGLGPHTGVESGLGITLLEKAVTEQKALGMEESCHLGNKGRTGVWQARSCICSHS